MIKRSIIDYLNRWRNSDLRKPLILRGARQVGKTTVINEFGKQYDNYLYFNLEELQDREVLEREMPLSNKIDLMYASKMQLKHEGETLLFIDEIQNSPKAIGLLRYFYEQRNDIHVIAAGSLLENLVDVKMSFPVGRVEFAAMRPCSFQEFASTTECQPQLEYAIRDPFNSQPMHHSLMSFFNQYTIVGGMPEAVNHYAQHRDILALDRIYETLLTAYQGDVEKYVRQNKLVNAVRFILTNGWGHAGEIIKLGNFAGSEYGSKDIRAAFQLLEKAMLLELSYPTTTTLLPALGETRRMPKLLWLDTGLVNYSAHIRQEIIKATNIQDVWRGRIAEHVVAQELLTLNNKVSQRRAFWTKNGGGGSAEVDFVWTYQSTLFPIEVKAGHNSHLRSLHSFVDASPYDIAIRVWSEPFSVEEHTTIIKGKRFKLVNLPFYLVGNMETILQKI